MKDIARDVCLGDKVNGTVTFHPQTLLLLLICIFDSCTFKKVRSRFCFVLVHTFSLFSLFYLLSPSYTQKQQNWSHQVKYKEEATFSDDLWQAEVKWEDKKKVEDWQFFLRALTAPSARLPPQSSWRLCLLKFCSSF